ncbi:hypothetical protein JCM1840_006593 [Sporobolomyces johnsonii]
MSYSTPRISAPWPHPHVPYLPSPPQPSGPGGSLRPSLARATRKAECVIKGGQKPEVTGKQGRSVYAQTAKVEPTRIGRPAEEALAGSRVAGAILAASSRDGKRDSTGVCLFGGVSTCVGTGLPGVA